MGLESSGLCLWLALVSAQETEPQVPTGADAFVEDVTVLYELHGEAAGDQFGWVARVVGDLDEDGVLDFATSAPTHAGGGVAAGKLYACSGKTGETIWTFSGDAGDGLGNGVGRANDLDEDGIPDVAVGAPSAGRRPGRSFVLSGFDGSIIHEFTAGVAGDGFGLKTCGIADVDGDGVGDVAVGATRSGAGRVYVYSGANGEIITTLNGEAPGSAFGSALDAQLEGASPLLAVGAMAHAGTGRAYAYRFVDGQAQLAFTIDPDATSANLGMYFVAMMGDVDGDGTEDVYASDWNNAAKGPSTGRVFVHSGKTGARILTVTGHRAGEGFGTSPSQAGDVDGDGHADLIVGAWQNRDGAVSGGKCYLHSGKDGHLMQAYTCKVPNDTFGFDATHLGDVDGDGGHDFLLTSGWSAVHGPQTGRVFVIQGPRPTKKGGAKDD